MSQIQNLILEILVNPAVFQQLEKDPRILAESFSLDAQETRQLLNLNPKEMKTFRNIVSGTRSHRFTEMLPRSSSYLNKEWHSLLENFFSSTVIRSHENENDFILFTSYLEQNLKDFYSADLVRFERALVMASDPRLRSLYPLLTGFKSQHAIESLFEPQSPLEKLETAIGYQIQMNDETQELDIFEVVHE